VTVVPDGAPTPDGSAAAERELAGRWQPAADETITPARPPRPTAIDFASTVFIVSGVFRLLAVALALAAPPDKNLVLLPGYVVAEAVIQGAAIVLGILIRYGRGWLVAANFAAVIAFIQLLSLVGVVSLAFGLLFAIAFVAIFRNRPWFLETAVWRRADQAERRP
jgi:hypothetical protein